VRQAGTRHASRRSCLVGRVRQKLSVRAGFRPFIRSQETSTQWVVTAVQMNQEPSDSSRPFNGAWLAVGVGVGVAIGTATKNLAMGICVGVIVGVSLGFALRRHR